MSYRVQWSGGRIAWWVLAITFGVSSGACGGAAPGSDVASGRVVAADGGTIASATGALTITFEPGSLTSDATITIVTQASTSAGVIGDVHEISIDPPTVTFSGATLSIESPASAASGTVIGQGLSASGPFSALATSPAGGRFVASITSLGVFALIPPATGACACDTGSGTCEPGCGSCDPDCGAPSSCPSAPPLRPGTDQAIDPAVCAWTGVVEPGAGAAGTYDLLCDDAKGGESLHVLASQHPNDLDIRCLASLAGVGIAAIALDDATVSYGIAYLWVDDVFVSRIAPRNASTVPGTCGLPSPDEQTLVLDPGLHTWRVEAFATEHCTLYHDQGNVLCGDDFDPQASLVARWSDALTTGVGTCSRVHIGPEHRIGGSAAGATVTSTPPATAQIGAPWTYQVEVDGLGAGLQFELTTAPSGMTIGATTGLIQWTPTSAGLNDVAVSVTDGAKTAKQEFSVEVIDCGSGTHLEGTACVPNCSTNGDCKGAGSVCNAVTGACEAGPTFWQWAVKVGGASNYGFSNAVVADSSGNVTIAGYFDKAAQFGATSLEADGPYDSNAFVARLDSQGAVLWVTAVEGKGEPLSVADPQKSQATSLAIDGAGNVYVTGWFRSVASFGSIEKTTYEYDGEYNTGLDQFVGKLSPDGDWLWVATAHGVGNLRVGVNDGGDLFAAARIDEKEMHFDGEVVSAETSDSLVVAKLADGQWSWTKVVKATTGSSGSNTDTTYVAVSDAGEATFAGVFDSVYDFGGHVVSSEKDSATFVARIDGGGNWKWAAVARAPGDLLQAEGVVVDADGNAYVTGLMWGDGSFGSIQVPAINGAYTDAFVAKVDTAGQWQWARAVGRDDGKGEIARPCIALSEDGTIITAAAFYGGNQVFGDLKLEYGTGGATYLAAMNADGEWLWADVGIQSAGDALRGVAAGPGTSVFMTGRHGGTSKIGATALEATGEGELWVGRYDRGAGTLP